MSCLAKIPSDSAFILKIDWFLVLLSLPPFMATFIRRAVGARGDDPFPTSFWDLYLVSNPPEIEIQPALFSFLLPNLTTLPPDYQKFLGSLNLSLFSFLKVILVKTCGGIFFSFNRIWDFVQFGLVELDEQDSLHKLFLHPRFNNERCFACIANMSRLVYKLTSYFQTDQLTS